ncbi:hypothetical protein ACTWP6_29615 [Mycobacterium sp. 4D054]|uniref:hypothetical protein n=1 Tax=Mycobacterium sp. 4D054 TaxID=3457440 RepID=UPI003FD05DBB
MRSRLLSAISIVPQAHIVVQIVGLELCRVFIGEALVDIALDGLADRRLDQLTKRFAPEAEVGVEVIGAQEFGRNEVGRDQLVESLRRDLRPGFDD